MRIASLARWMAGPVCAAGLLVVGPSAAAAVSGSPPLDTVSATGQIGDTFPPLTMNISAQGEPSGLSSSGTASISVVRVTTSGPVTCLRVTGPDQGGGTPGAPTTAVLNFQTPTGVVTMQLVDNGGNGSDLVTIAQAGRTPADCSGSLPQTDALTLNGRAVVFDAPLVPTSKDQCKHDGWQSFGTMFKNQGQCVAFVERGP